MKRYKGIYKEMDYGEQDTLNFDDNWRDFVEKMRGLAMGRSITLSIITINNHAINAIFSNCKIVRLGTLLTFKTKSGDVIDISKNDLKTYYTSKAEGGRSLNFHLIPNKSMDNILINIILTPNNFSTKHWRRDEMIGATNKLKYLLTLK
jgi:hypothetical protein